MEGFLYSYLLIGTCFALMSVYLHVSDDEPEYIPWWAFVIAGITWPYLVYLIIRRVVYGEKQNAK